MNGITRRGFIGAVIICGEVPGDFFRVKATSRSRFSQRVLVKIIGYLYRSLERSTLFRAVERGCVDALMLEQFPFHVDSTAEAGKRVQMESGAGRLLLIHHDPRYTDDFLKRQEKTLGVRYIRQGEVIRL